MGGSGIGGGSHQIQSNAQSHGIPPSGQNPSKKPEVKPEERVFQNLNKAILEHLELAGFNKVAKIFKDEMVNGPSKTTTRARSGSRDKQRKDHKDNMQP